MVMAAMEGEGAMAAVGDTHLTDQSQSKRVAAKLMLTNNSFIEPPYYKDSL